MHKQTILYKYMIFEEAKAKLHERYSCLEPVRASELVSVLPRCVGSPKDIKTGIKTVLDAKLNIFSLRYSGVPVAYGNICCLDSVGRIHADKPLIHFHVTLDIIIFRPNIGSYVSGVVNKISSDHLGVLIHNIFNASVLKPKDHMSELPRKKFKEGQEVIFEVTGLHCYNSLLVIEGKLIDKSRLPEMMKENGKRSITSEVADNGVGDFQNKTNLADMNETSALDTSVKELFEIPKIAHFSDETSHKKEVMLNVCNSAKKRKRKSVITGEEIGLLKKSNSAKKKKRHLHSEDCSEQTVTTAFVDANLTAFELEKRKRKKHLQQAECAEEEEHDSSSAGLRRKKKPKESIDNSAKV